MPVQGDLSQGIDWFHLVVVQPVSERRADVSDERQDSPVRLVRRRSDGGRDLCEVFSLELWLASPRHGTAPPPTGKPAGRRLEFFRGSFFGLRNFRRQFRERLLDKEHVRSHLPGTGHPGASHK